MMVCAKCGFEVTENDRFCGKCGGNEFVEKTSYVPIKYCNYCSAELEPGSKFCSTCGKTCPEETSISLDFIDKNKTKAPDPNVELDFLKKDEITNMESMPVGGYKSTVAPVPVKKEEPIPMESMSTGPKNTETFNEENLSVSKRRFPSFIKLPATALNAFSGRGGNANDKSKENVGKEAPKAPVFSFGKKEEKVEEKKENAVAAPVVAPAPTMPEKIEILPKEEKVVEEIKAEVEQEAEVVKEVSKESAEERKEEKAVPAPVVDPLDEEDPDAQVREAEAKALAAEEVKKQAEKAVDDAVYAEEKAIAQAEKEVELIQGAANTAVESAEKAVEEAKSLAETNIKAAEDAVETTKEDAKKAVLEAEKGVDTAKEEGNAKIEAAKKALEEAEVLAEKLVQDAIAHIDDVKKEGEESVLKATAHIDEVKTEEDQKIAAAEKKIEEAKKLGEKQVADAKAKVEATKAAEKKKVDDAEQKLKDAKDSVKKAEEGIEAAKKQAEIDKARIAEEKRRREEEERKRREEEERRRREEEERRRKEEEARQKRLKEMHESVLDQEIKAIEKAAEDPQIARSEMEAALDAKKQLEEAVDPGTDLSDLDKPTVEIKEFLGIIYYKEKAYKLAEPYLKDASDAGRAKAAIYEADLNLRNRINIPKEPGVFANRLETMIASLKDEDLEERKKGYYVLAKVHRDGIGVERSLGRALEYYQKSAELGDAEAMATVGKAYMYGDGVRKDGKTGLEWNRKSAEAGNISGIRNLGLCYDFGIGTKKDAVKAIENYRLLLEKTPGDRYIMLRMSYCLSDPDHEYSHNPTTDMHKEAFDLAERALQSGEEGANYLLGCFYMNGKVVPRDCNRAMNYFTKAMTLGGTQGLQAKKKMECFVKTSSGNYALK